MNIHTIWGWRSTEEGPELLDAWDEFSVEQNSEGWLAAPEKAAEAAGIPMRFIRTAVIRIAWEQVERLYEDIEIAGTVEPTALSRSESP